jgi:hypothetical protein
MHTAATSVSSSSSNVGQVNIRCRMLLAAHFAARHCHRVHDPFHTARAAGKRPAQHRCGTVREQLWLQQQLVACQAVKPGRAAVDGELKFNASVIIAAAAVRSGSGSTGSSQQCFTAG